MRAERVEPKLLVARSDHAMPLPILQVDDLQLGFGDDHTVAGAEPTRNNVGEVEALLDRADAAMQDIQTDASTAFVGSFTVVLREGLEAMRRELSSRFARSPKPPEAKAA